MFPSSAGLYVILPDTFEWARDSALTQNAEPGSTLLGDGVKVSQSPATETDAQFERRVVKAAGPAPVKQSCGDRFKALMQECRKARSAKSATVDDPAHTTGTPTQPPIWLHPRTAATRAGLDDSHTSGDKRRRHGRKGQGNSQGRRRQKSTRSQFFVKTAAEVEPFSRRAKCSGELPERRR